MSDHYFSAAPAARSRPASVELALPDLTLTLTTDRGTFSADHVDAGTRLLLQEAPHPSGGGTLADLGCGYGPIACTLARRDPTATVWAVDVNERAVALCRQNAEDLGLTNVAVAVDDAASPTGALPADLRFTAIYSNPPIRIGKSALHALLDAWLDRLTPEGVAYLVVQKHLGSDSLHRWLDDGGRPTERLTSRAGYRILAVRARTDAPAA